MKKIALQLNYEISEQEKKQAVVVINLFNDVLDKLSLVVQHLKFMENSFSSDKDSITPEEVLNRRAALRQFRDKLIDLFNDMILDKSNEGILPALKAAEIFDSDMKISNLKNLVTDSFVSLKDHTNKFIELFSDLEDKEFVQNVIAGIGVVLKESSKFEEIIRNNFLKYIKENIFPQNVESKILDKPVSTKSNNKPYVQLLHENIEKHLKGK